MNKHYHYLKQIFAIGFLLAAVPLAASDHLLSRLMDDHYEEISEEEGALRAARDRFTVNNAIVCIEEGNLEEFMSIVPVHVSPYAQSSRGFTLEEIALHYSETAFVEYIKEAKGAYTKSARTGQDADKSQ